MNNRESVHTVRVTGPITLDDLRWLVEQCKDLSPQSKVEIKKIDDQRDPFEEIAVKGKPKDKPSTVYRESRPTPPPPIHWNT